MAVSLWPAQGLTVLDENGVVVPDGGISIASVTAYYTDLIVRGHLLTYSPLGGGEPVSVVTRPAIYSDTVANIVAAIGAEEDQAALANGYSSPGDGGGGMLRWDAAADDPADGGTVFGAGSGRWRRVYSGAVNAKWFGAVGDGVANDQPAIQAAINFAVANKIGEVYLPSGRYLINSTLHLYKNNSTSTITLRGDGRAYRGNSAFGGSTLIANFSNAPALNIQGARGTAVRDLAILGLNSDWVESNGLGYSAAGGTPPSLDDTDGANWVDTGLAASADSRYAPYAGIAVDGWSGSEPGTAYPTSAVAYGQSFSSDVQIDGVHISGFVAGVAIQPCDADGNGDFAKILNSQIEYCRYGVSIGNSQARSTAIRDCSMLYVHTCFTNNTHGKQIGKFAGSIDNLSVAFCNRLFSFTNSYYWGPLAVTQLYAETLWKIGSFNQSGEVGRNVHFRGCELGFEAQLCPERGLPTCIVDDSGGRTQGITFESCTLRSYPRVLSFFAAGVHLIDCELVPAQEAEGNAGTAKEPILDDTPAPYLQAFHNATGGFCPKNFAARKSHSHRSLVYDLSTNLAHLSRLAADGEGTLTSRKYCVSAWAREPANEYGQRITNARASTPIAKASLSSCTFTRSATKPGELTLVFSSLADWQAEGEGWMPGDAIYDDVTGTVFVIRSRSTTTVIAEIQNNYYWTGSTYSARETEVSTSSGNFYPLNCRVYTPANPIFGDLTAGSTSVTNVGRADGFAGLVNSDIAVDDWIYAIDQVVDYDVGATSAKIAAIHASGTPITLGGVAAGTRARKQLQQFIRPAPANAGSR